MDILEQLSDADCLTGASDAAVAATERRLNLKFAPEYRRYTLALGAVSIGGVELTGVVPQTRLSVTAVTEAVRSLYDLPQNLYVIEQVGIDGLYILQDESGTVWECGPNGRLKQICDNMSSYLAQTLPSSERE